jgi:hypothetical protein
MTVLRELGQPSMKKPAKELMRQVDIFKVNGTSDASHVNHGK